VAKRSEGQKVGSIGTNWKLVKPETDETFPSKSKHGIDPESRIAWGAEELMSPVPPF
jgi:hypothetical protein